MRRVLSELCSAILPAGIYQRDADGVPVIMNSSNGTTEMTPVGIERALARQFVLRTAYSADTRGLILEIPMKIRANRAGH